MRIDWRMRAAVETHVYFISSGSTGSGRSRAASPETAGADSSRTRSCPMPSTCIAARFYRSNKESLPATRTTDIPGREPGSRQQPRPMRGRRGPNFGGSNSGQELPKRRGYGPDPNSGHVFRLATSGSTEPAARWTASSVDGAPILWCGPVTWCRSSGSHASRAHADA
jgi:hypothetical protein